MKKAYILVFIATLLAHCGRRHNADAAPGIKDTTAVKNTQKPDKGFDTTNKNDGGYWKSLCVKNAKENNAYVQQIKDLKDSITKLNRLLTSTPTKGSSDKELQDQLSKIKSEKADLEKKLNASNKELAVLKKKPDTKPKSETPVVTDKRERTKRGETSDPKTQLSNFFKKLEAKKN